jgi:ATP-binding cassette, subfamily B, bacterial
VSGSPLFGFLARPREVGGGTGRPPAAGSGTGRTVASARFREEARQASSATRELGPPLEKAGFARPSWPADLGELRLRARSRHPVPVQFQPQASDCGPVSLMMTLGYHGIQVGLEQLRQETGCGRDGVSARSLLAAARGYGLPGRGVRTSLDGLRRLPSGSILFWKFNHFVVLERATRQYVYVVDPAYGRRRLRTEDVGGLFTGVALEFDAPLRVVSRSHSAEPPRSAWRYLAHFIPRSVKWLPLTAASVAILIFGLLAPLSTAYVVDHRGLGGELTPVQAALAVAFVALSFFLFQVVRSSIILALQAGTDKRATLAVLDHLLALPYGFFAQRRPGDLVMRVRTSTVVRAVLSAQVIAAVFDGVLAGCYLAVFFLLDLQVALWVSVLAAAEIGVLLSTWQPLMYLAGDELESQARSNSGLNELLDGIGTVKAGGLDEVMGGRWAQTLVEEINAGTRRRRLYNLCAAVVASVQFMAPLLVLVISAFKVSAGQLSLGEMTAFTSLSIGVFSPLTSLVQAGFQVATLKPPLTRLGDILDTEPDEPERMVKYRFGADADLAVAGVRFQYPGAKTPVLTDIDLAVPAGSFVALMGPSGCGKSTLAMILSGLYRPTAGQVLVGGTALDTIDRAALRRSISFVNQDARIFAGSIRENLTMGAAAADGYTCDYVRAATIAQIHDDIAALPMGYETLLGPGGSGLSGGQCQRIALARALVRRPRILILDEATSALDQIIEKKVISGIRELGCTVFLTTHRLTAAAEADEICIISDGKIVQRVSRSLLSAQPDLYHNLSTASSRMSDPRGDQAQIDIGELGSWTDGR